jgi:hypothetical protein
MRKRLSPKKPDAIADSIEKFSALPLHFLNFYGSTSFTEVMEAIDQAIYAFDA